MSPALSCPLTAVSGWAIDRPAYDLVVTTPDTSAVRAWARDNGLAVAERGRLPAEVHAAYAAANGGGKTAKPAKAAKATKAAKPGPAAKPRATTPAKTPAKTPVTRTRTPTQSADEADRATEVPSVEETTAPGHLDDPRVTALEAQVAELAARLARLEQPAPVGAKPSRFRRRS